MNTLLVTIEAAKMRDYLCRDMEIAAAGGKHAGPSSLRMGNAAQEGFCLPAELAFFKPLMLAPISLRNVGRWMSSSRLM